MKPIIISDEQVFDVTPKEVAFIGPVPDYRCRNIELVDGYQVNINFKGNMMPLFTNEELAKEYGLLPNGAEIRCRLYSEARDVTHVRYLFKGGFFHDGEKRAERFKNKIQDQMANPVNINNPDNKVSPLRVSKTPEQCFNGKKDGYKVSVVFEGEWGNYPPLVLSKNKYYPRGAQVLNFDYNFAEHITNVDYLFKHGLFNGGMKRAWKFIDKLNAQINDNKQNMLMYKPVVVDNLFKVRYDDGVFKELILSVHFGNLGKQIDSSKTPRPECKNVYLTDNCGFIMDYLVRYHFYGKSFKDAFWDMNKFRIKMLAAMKQNENIK